MISGKSQEVGTDTWEDLQKMERRGLVGWWRTEYGVGTAELLFV
jgi:hypothetical protein